MPVKINFSETPEGPKKGKYPVVITKSEDGTSQSGHPTIKVQCKITDGEFEGQTIFVTFSLQPKALFGIRKFLKALGEDTDVDMEYDHDEVLNRELWAEGEPSDFGFNVKNWYPME